MFGRVLHQSDSGNSGYSCVVPMQNKRDHMFLSAYVCCYMAQFIECACNRIGLLWGQFIQISDFFELWEHLASILSSLFLLHLLIGACHGNSFI